MLHTKNKNEYSAHYRPQYERLFAAESPEDWVNKPGSTVFRDRGWAIAPLAGDPWRAGSGARRKRVAFAAEGDPEHMRRGYRYERFWRPWECVLRERRVDRLLFSVCELLGDDFLVDGAACCAECDLDWNDIERAGRKLPISIADACAVFSMSSDWAMYCWEGFSVLGGTPPLMVRYGELAGGWDRLRADFQAHLDTDYEFHENDRYRASVELAFAGPDAAWTKLVR